MDNRHIFNNRHLLDNMLDHMFYRLVVHRLIDFVMDESITPMYSMSPSIASVTLVITTISAIAFAITPIVTPMVSCQGQCYQY